MGKRFAILIVAAAGVMALGAQTTTAAPVQQLSCGDTITTDTTLHHDLVNCPNNGIIIGADDITLDLNGHRIDGDGTVTGCPDEFCDVGVLNDGHDGVTVTNGSVREFDIGIRLVGAPHNRLLGISSSSRNGFIGIMVVASARSVIRNSSGSGSPNPKEGAGLLLLSSRHVRILHNSFRHNAHNGIEMAGSNNNLIKGNVFSRNDDGGVVMFGGERNRMTHNRFVRNGAGITLNPCPVRPCFRGSPTNRTSRNVITHNRVSRGRVGIRIEKGRRNLVAHNVVTRARGAGIRLGKSNPLRGGAHNVVRRNLVRGSRGDGFVVAKSDRHGHLKRNISVGARDDGFDVEGRRSKLTRNEARRNGDLGIEAVRGVIDGGGNRASGNGDPRQCINVVCR